MNPRLRIPYLPPLDWRSLFGFLAARATPGVEVMGGGGYRRNVRLGSVSGVVEARLGTANDLEVLASPELFESSALVAAGFARHFDLWANTAAISALLSRDDQLARLVRRFPGIRVPGSWDPFETAVRAILGQVVSVAQATRSLGRLVALHGEPSQVFYDTDLSHFFPSAGRLAEADLTGIGLSRQKIVAVRSLAVAVSSGSLRFDDLGSLEEALAALQEIPGIGRWTANYVAMRALGHADAFPAGDLILRRAAARPGETLSETQLIAKAESWRPYRAYAAMLLWASYSQPSRVRQGGGERGSGETNSPTR